MFKLLSFLIGLDIWREFIPHILGHNNDIEKIRSVMEKALTAGVFHVAKGELLWNAYRYMEMAALQTTRDKNPDEVLAQADTVCPNYFIVNFLFHS